MINYFNFKKFRDKFLLTNDFGRYSFLDISGFRDLLEDKLENNNEVSEQLKRDYFIYDTDDEEFSRLSSFEIYSSKNYLYKSTSLHIFVLTSACNQSCVYCQAQSENQCSKGFMTKEIAEKAVDVALSSPSEYLDFEFQGGEPLLNFEVLKYIVEYSKAKSDKCISYSVVTNLTLLTDEMIDFIAENNINVSTSVDGNELVHNLNRPYQNGKGTFSDVFKSIKKLQERAISVGAIQTTTKSSLPYYREIVDTYVDAGFNSIFIRPLTPLGYAGENWASVGYSPEEFIEFYKNILDYIISINKKGCYLREGHAHTFLRKILSGFSPNYMELRSPCGAALGQLAYYYDGNIFTCDEARMLYEMGDSSFCVGNIGSSDYNSIMNSKVSALAAKSSVLEALPSCGDCVYQPYCGVCPVINYAINNNVYEKSPREYKCKIYSGMLDSIFDILYFYEKDKIDVFRSWLE